MEGVMENGANRAVDSVKLFVGQLPKQMSEQQLAEVFAEAGTVYEINIIKDKLTKQSRGVCSLYLDQWWRVFCADCLLLVESDFVNSLARLECVLLKNLMSHVSGVTQVLFDGGLWQVSVFLC